MQINGWHFRKAAEQIEAVLGSSWADEPKRERSDREKRDAMNKLWRSSKAIEANDPVGRYLGRRVGLTCFPTCLRTASNLHYQSDRSSFHPAMIAMVTAPDGAPSSVHRTYLTADGRKASVDEPRRMMPGTIAKGSAVRLAPPMGVLGIAEGIETALSASALFAVPCWAAVNAGMLAAWQPPPEVKRILIFGDNDPGMPARPRLMRLQDGSDRTSAPSRSMCPPIPGPTGMTYTDYSSTLLMMLADQSQTRPISDKKWLIPERLTVLPSEKENGMGAKERITRELIMAHLRSLERQGFVVPSVDPTGRSAGA